jgi:phospholipid transport system substrate-binding protein
MLARTRSVYALRGFALAVLFVIALLPRPAQAEGLQDFVDRLLEASQDAVAPGANHAQHCRKILASSYDVANMARSVAGDAWNKASQGDRNAFRAAFENSTVTSCARLLGIEQGVALAHIGNRDAQGGDKLIGIRVISQEKGERTWIWRVRNTGGAYRVVDVVVDGRSLVAGERADIARVIESANGELSAATDYLQKRTR